MGYPVTSESSSSSLLKSGQRRAPPPASAWPRANTCGANAPVSRWNPDHFPPEPRPSLNGETERAVDRERENEGTFRDVGYASFDVAEP